MSRGTAPASRSEPMQVIFTADDFGRAAEINRAVERAHREGLLTAASLMVGGAALDQAVEIARANPGLDVGLHLVVSDGNAVLAHAEIPDVTDPNGRFRDPVRAGLAYALSWRARRQIAAEIEAQFARFAATGLRLSHVDGHQHMHLHPAVLGHALRLARAHGAHGFRLPREPLGPAWIHGDRAGLGPRLGEAAALRLLARRARRRMPDVLVVPEHACGLLQSGAMREAYVAALLGALRGPCAEIYFHPTTGPRLDARGPNRGDLETLLSPNLRRLVLERGIRPSGYRNVAAPCPRVGGP